MPHSVPDSAVHLLDAHGVERYRTAMAHAVDRTAAAIRGADRPTTGTSPEVLEDKVATIDLAQPLGDLDDALAELDEVYLRDAMYFHHPRYMAHLNCPVAVPAVVGDAVLSAVNTSVDTWDQSLGATLIEQRLVRWTNDRIGFGPAADGVFTSGGSQSNLQALSIAREHARARRPLDPTGGAPVLRILASEVAHFSVDKAAKLLGLGPGAVRAVAVDDALRMRPDALATELARCNADGDLVMAVVATAGTTDFGSIDPLVAVADACAAAGVWMHVDAAYGCGLLISPRRRHLLTGIERADSVTVDYHKSFFQPVSASAVLVRDGAALRHVTYNADYLNPREARATGGGRDQVDKSLQTTRRPDAIKLWLTLRVMGAPALGELFDAVIDLADEVWTVLEDDPRFTPVVRPQLSTLVFRFRPGSDLHPDLVDRVHRETRRVLFETGDAAVASTKVGGRTHLKLTLLNPRTTPEEVRDVLAQIADVAGEQVAALGVGR